MSQTFAGAARQSDDLSDELGTRAVVLGPCVFDARDSAAVEGMAADENRALNVAHNNSAILELRNVSKSFGPTPVLQNVNLEVPRGSIVALLGASGSGKTTLLQIIAGLQEPDAGTLTVDGRNMNAVPPFKRPVNMMFQSYALFPHLTVRGNIEYGLRARGVRRDERARLVAWALELAQACESGRPATGSTIRRAAATSRSRAVFGDETRRSCCSMSRWPRSIAACARKCNAS